MESRTREFRLNMGHGKTHLDQVKVNNKIDMKKNTIKTRIKLYKPEKIQSQDLYRRIPFPRSIHT